MDSRICILFAASAALLPAAVAVRSDFEGGSIGRVEQLAPDHLRCAVKGEVDQDGRNRQASWYYFEISGAAGRALTIDLTDLPGEYNYRPGNLAINGGTRPFISYDRQTWTPLPDSAVEWVKSVPLLRIHFTPARSPVWIAHVPPYAAQNLANLLADLKHNPDVAVDDIGKSAGGRSLLMLTVTSHTRPARDKKVLWLIAREHAWESGTSWAMDGAARFLAKDDPAAARLRDGFIFKLFPMADPDGVARGGVRFNLNGYDVNRNWDVGDAKLMPEIAALRKAVLDWTDSGHSIDLFVNLHDDNTDYIEGPLTAAGPDYRQTVNRLGTLLAKETFFELKTRDWAPGEIAHGRMDTCQYLFHAREIPTLLLEQSVQKNAGLGRLFNVPDYRRFGERLVSIMAAAVGGPAGGNLLPNAEFAPGGAAMPDGWTVWAPRDALRPQARVIRAPGGNLLSLEAQRAEAFGKWESVASAIQPGRTYRFEVWYRPAGIAHEQVSVPVILTWYSDASGKSMVQRDFVDRVRRHGEWRQASRTLAAPARAQSVRAELGLRWAAKASVTFKDPRLEEIGARPNRRVRIVTTRIVPAADATVAANLALMGRILDEAGARKPDLVLLSENFPDRGVRQPIEETSQTIPGPATELLSRKARQYAAYVTASLHERDGDLIYNTAVLIDREGRIAGKYRKTHLAMIEGENGVTPGRDYPVFPTDFGKVGIMTCWDNWFSEPARILRLKGAEVLLLPIAGDGDPHHWDIISRARAIDNGVYLVSSDTVGQSSRIIDPAGNVLAETSARFGVAFAEIDLDQERRLHWLSVGSGDGEPRSLYIDERRPDTYKPLTEDR